MNKVVYIYGSYIFSPKTHAVMKLRIMLVAFAMIGLTTCFASPPDDGTATSTIKKETPAAPAFPSFTYVAITAMPDFAYASPAIVDVPAYSKHAVVRKVMLPASPAISKILHINPGLRRC